MDSSLHMPRHLRCHATQQPLTEALVLSPCGHEVNESALRVTKQATAVLKKCPVSDCPHAVDSFVKNRAKSQAALKFIQQFDENRYFLSLFGQLFGHYPGTRGYFRGDGLILQSHNGSLINMFFLAKRDEYALVLGVIGDGNEMCNFFAVNQIPYKKYQPNGIDYVVEIEEKRVIRKVINILNHENDFPDGYLEYLLSVLE